VFSDVFWTGFFTFAGGVVGAVGAHFGVKSQINLQQQRLGLDALRYNNDESYRERDEESAAREQRRALYLSYLATLDVVLHAPAVTDLTVDAMRQRWAAFVKADDEIELGGTNSVREAGYPLYMVVSKIREEYTNILSGAGAGWPQDAITWYREKISSEFDLKRAALVDAMRRDLHGAEDHSE
jgi:hypothetical protein